MIAPDGTAYEISGDGPAVVLIHGLGLNRHMWQWLVPELGDYRVLAYDLSGHGDSPEPDGPLDLRVYGEQVLRLIDHCEIARCAVVGFSLGGQIARRIAIDHGHRVRAMAIVASAHDRTQEERAAVMVRVEQVQRDGPGATVEAALERWFTEPFRRSNASVIDQVRRWVLANRPGFYPQAYRVMAEGDAELVQLVRGIRCPTLVMTGDEDYGNPPEMSRRMAAAIPDAEVAIVPGLRHMGMAENPKVYNAPLIDFLERNAPDRPPANNNDS